MGRESRPVRRALALFAGTALALAAGAANADDVDISEMAVADGVTIPTQAQCDDAWDDSGAAQTCGAGVSSNYYGSLPAATVRVTYNVTFDSSKYDRPNYDDPSSLTIVWAGCEVRTLCMPAGQGADRTVKNNLGVDTHWAGDLADTSTLNNCNGTLTAGSC